jgi:acyl-CoA reductase-like NAD-dependent aldehyde dehydrogenase
MSDIIMLNPATGEKLGVKQTMTTKQVLDSYNKAREKSISFKKTAIQERVSEIIKIKRYIVENMNSIIDNLSKDLGKTKSEALLMEIFPVLDCIKYYEKNAEKILRDNKINTPLALIGRKSYIFYEPLGVVLVIAPWNFPFTLSLIPIITAVLAGNTVIYKPSEQATYSAIVMEKILKESGFIPGVVTFIYGKSREISDALIEGKPDKIMLTGSTTTGKKIMEKAAKYLIPVELELGGKDPMIVFEDANLERATSATVWGSLLNCGQACVAIERIYVQDKIYDRFVKLLIDKVKKVKQGWGDVDTGCINNVDQVKIIEDQVKDAVDKGAKILVGGKHKDKSLFYPPTVLVNVNHKMKIMQDETFGPIICIMKFKDESEAVKLANDTIYGLNASVWSHDKNRAVRVAKQITTGGVAVNNALTASANFALPFGGAKQSGIGRYHGSYGLHAFSNIKAVFVEKDKKDHEINWYPFRNEKYERFLTTFKNLFSDKMSDKIKGLPSMIRLLRSDK